MPYLTKHGIFATQLGPVTLQIGFGNMHSQIAIIADPEISKDKLTEKDVSSFVARPLLSLHELRVNSKLSGFTVNSLLFFVTISVVRG